MAEPRDYASDEEDFIDDEPAPAPVKKPVAVFRKPAARPEGILLFTRTNWDGVLAEHMMELTDRHKPPRDRLKIIGVRHFKADEQPSIDDYYTNVDHLVFCDLLPDTKSYEHLRKRVDKGSQVHVFTRQLNIARQVEDFEWITLKYKADQTSAELMWTWLRDSGYVHDADLPRCTPYIHDMTVWDWKHAPESLYFYTNIQSEKLSKEHLTKIEKYTEVEFRRWLERGEIIKKYNERLIEQFARNPTTRYIAYEDRVYRVTMVESRHFINEIANYLLDHHRVHVAAVYHYDLDAKTWRVSLRTAPEDSIDVSVVAKQYGGGGGPSAAAFKYDKDLSGLFIDKKDIHKYLKKDPVDYDNPDDILKAFAAQRAKQREDVDPDADLSIRTGSITLV